MRVKLITIFILLCINSVGYSQGLEFQSFTLSEEKLTNTTGITVEMCCKGDNPSPQESGSNSINILIMVERGKSIQVYDEMERVDVVFTCTSETTCRVVRTLQAPQSSLSLHARSYCPVKGLKERIKKDFSKAKEIGRPIVPLIIEGKPDISVSDKKFALVGSCQTNIAEMNDQ